MSKFTRIILLSVAALSLWRLRGPFDYPMTWSPVRRGLLIATNECPDFSGTYRFNGDWVGKSEKLNDPGITVPFLAWAHLQPPTPGGQVPTHVEINGPLNGTIHVRAFKDGQLIGEGKIQRGSPPFECFGGSYISWKPGGMLKSIEVHRSWDGALVSHEEWAPDCIFAFVPLCKDLGSTSWSRWPSSNSVSNTSPRK